MTYRLPEKMPEPEWLGSLVSEDAEDPRPFLVPGVRVEFAPVSPKAIRKGREAALVAMVASPGDNEAAFDAMACEIVRHGVRRWEGIGDHSGKVLAIDATSIALFIASPVLMVAATDVYVHPALERDAEGNASAGSPDGTGMEATPADAIATPSATPTASAAAEPKGPRKRTAPTASTNA